LGWPVMFEGSGGAELPSKGLVRLGVGEGARRVGRYAWLRERRMWLALVVLACACLPMPWLVLYIIEQLDNGARPWC
jgi:hypothetical protein